jgi:hypothetical protein
MMYIRYEEPASRSSRGSHAVLPAPEMQQLSTLQSGSYLQVLAGETWSVPTRNVETNVKLAHTSRSQASPGGRTPVSTEQFFIKVCVLGV